MSSAAIDQAFFPWAGGKHHMLKRLLALIPAHKTYAEVFGGAANLLFAKEPSEIEAYNDLNGDLVNLFTVTRDHPIQLLERVWMIPHSRELFEGWSTQILKTNEPADRIERAARFYYCLCNSFGGRGPGAGWAFERECVRHHPLTWYRRVTKIPDFYERLRDVHIDHLDFRRFIENWAAPETFLFLDPPYLETSPYRGVPDFTEKDHRDLYKLLVGVQAKWLLTVNDHPLLRELYAAFRIETEETSLAVEKISGDESRGVLKHLIITNYDAAKTRAFAPPKQTLLTEVPLE